MMADYRARPFVSCWVVAIVVLAGCTANERQGESRASNVEVWQEGAPLPPTFHLPEAKATWLIM